MRSEYEANEALVISQKPSFKALERRGVPKASIHGQMRKDDRVTAVIYSLCAVCLISIIAVATFL
jgi:hypothetical protein